MKSIYVSQITAHIPNENEDYDFQIYHCQKSNQKVLNMPVHSEKTSYDDNGLHIYHTAEANNNNVRAYIDTLARSLQCSMDVQYADGKNLLLKYVASYVSKFKDTYISNG
ncbi:uncharacterized protein LOC130649277 [Hydractinia symbiolongicarpus]|uniref:uncharacterized protein LOC130649277 n=1 Tax=Hydractinia symbiolongicarpus TaxID=13093 RepID=UPI00254BEAD6|nr:uncharacterized protein LOC130649277 [Hydractinia symbiolongicarpus]